MPLEMRIIGGRVFDVPYFRRKIDRGRSLTVGLLIADFCMP